MLTFKALSKYVRVMNAGGRTIGKIVYVPGKFWQYSLDTGKRGDFFDTWPEAAANLETDMKNEIA